MQLDDLLRLRCPFCGCPLSLVDQPAATIAGAELLTGVLTCRCCAYPVVDGIPYLHPNQSARDAIALLTEGRPDDALLALLNLSDDAATRFRALRQAPSSATYRQALEILSPTAEGTYFLYRFSDPTYLVSQAVVRSLLRNEDLARGPLLDMCGGSGHLTRALIDAAPSAAVWLADFDYWKVWLARTFVAPACHPLCCDASQALPFAPQTFSFVLCSGAFEYIWPRRSFAGEMWRLAGLRGAVLITHTHNALCENPSQGMPLRPAEYRRLFEAVPARLFKESAVLDAVLGARPVRLDAVCSDDALSAEPALIVVATAREEVYRAYDAEAPRTDGRLAWNPLYVPAGDDGARVLRLSFPSTFYEAEFEDCHRYLPDEITVNDAALPRGRDAAETREFVARRVLLDLPERYL
jgi:uncharacterized protein YbaR (Trm112 family)